MPTVYFPNPGRDPAKNSNPPCVGPTVGANYRGFDTADALVKGLSDEAIAQRWKLNGVDREREDVGLPRFGPSRWR